MTQPGPLEDCIVDVAATGNALFADEALAAQEAASVDWVPLRAGAGLSSPLSLARTGDGILHAGFSARAADGSSVAQSVPLGAGEGAAEGLGTPTAGRLFTAADGTLHAAVAEVPGDGRPAGAYEYARGAGGGWTLVGALTTFGNSFLNAPDALAVDGGTLIASPMDGVARVFRTGTPAGDPGVAPTAALPDCLATSPALARDAASGEVWVAWAQTDCPQAGVFAQRVDPATGALVGAPVAAPGAGTPALGLDERLALSGRPGQAGVFLAYPAGDGSGVRLWRVGAAAATTIKRQSTATPRGVRIAADAAGGGLWLAWSEDRRIVVQPVAASGAARGAPRPADLPREAGLALSRDVQIAAQGTALEVVLAIRSGDTPGALYRARFER